MKIKIILLLFVIGFSFLSCTKKEAATKTQTKATVEVVGNSRLVKSGDLQIAFDLLDSKAYMNMMQDMKHSMGMDMGLVKNYLSITVIDTKKGKIIEASKIELSIKDPTGESIIIIPSSMGGSGMLHYGSPVDFAALGPYLISAKVEAMDKQVEADIEYIIK